MKTDRELLEAAAKAAGIEPHYPFGEGEIYVRFDGPWAHRDTSDAKGALKTWNPLTDDGDALRLAVKLNLSITPYPVYELEKHSVVVELKRHAECPRAESPLRYCMECSAPCQRLRQIAEVVPHNGDPDAATRRAIVCAAAAMAG